MMKGSENILRLGLYTLLYISIQIKRTLSEGKLYVKLDTYREVGQDKTTACIRLCVTTSPSGFLRCNLNTTKSTASVRVRNLPNKKIVIGYPHPHEYDFKFKDWRDNSVLSATVWKLADTKQNCDTTGPASNTSLGELSTIIPRLERIKTYHIGDKNVDKWELRVGTKLICDVPGCLLPCVPRDNITGHYKCSDGNKNCLSNWYGENCTSFCNSTASTYRCDRNGIIRCHENWFGANCSKFCNTSSETYTCDSLGQAHCKSNFFGVGCSTFCNISAQNYLCDNKGNRACLLHWFGKDCSTYCNNSAEHFKCDDEGNKVCLKNWYHPNCSKFCDNSDKRFKCTLDGDKICMQNWFGKDCEKFCNNTALLEGRATQYHCNSSGDKICSEHWYGEECDTSCTAVVESSGLYYCKVKKAMKTNVCCPNGWNDAKCLRECDNDENENIQKYKTKCEANEGCLCLNRTDAENICSYVISLSLVQENSSHDVSNVKLYGGLFGSIFLILIITTIVVVYVSLRKKETTATTASSLFFTNSQEIKEDVFSQKFNRAELTLSVDELLRRRQSSSVGLGLDNPGLMVANPLYDSRRHLRAAAPFEPMSSVAEDDAFPIDNTRI